MREGKYSGILLDNRGEICWVTIHRPGDRNSIDSALMKELGEVLSEIGKKPGSGHHLHRSRG